MYTLTTVEMLWLQLIQAWMNYKNNEQIINSNVNIGDNSAFKHLLFESLSLHLIHSEQPAMFSSLAHRLQVDLIMPV